MSLKLTPKEKKQIKNLMELRIRQMAVLFNDLENQLKAEEKIDENTELGTYETMHYPNEIYLYKHLYNPDLVSYSVDDFWNQDTGPRDAIWNELEENLSKKLYKKIENYLNRDNSD